MALLIDAFEEVFGGERAAFFMASSKFSQLVMLIGLGGEICAECRLMSNMMGEWSDDSSDE